VALALAGCASRSQPPPEALTVRAESLEPGGPAAGWYRSPSLVGAADEDPTRKVIADGIVQLAAEAHLPAPTRDGRLDRMADDLARLNPQAHLPSFELVAFLLSHYGVVEPEPQMRYGLVDPRSPANFVALAGPRLVEQLRDIPRARLGVGLAAVGDDLAVVVALQPQKLELGPVPRALDLGLVAHIEGRLFPGYQIPRVLVTFGDGTVDDVRVQGTAAHFQASLGCRGDRRGPLQVEIAAEGPRGPDVLALFPVFCAVEPPARSPALALDTGGSVEPEAVEAQLFKLINRDRARQGLGLVRADSRLGDVARAHSREMAETGVVSHVSPRTGNVRDRVLHARLDVALLGENVGQDYSAAGAHRSFMSSPGHRGNVVDPNMTAVGIGVVRGKEHGDPVSLYITEIFAAGLQ
jgi:uncharacterized protein YkwD